MLLSNVNYSIIWQQDNRNILHHNHITEHCENFKLLLSAQHGFRNKHSNTSNLLELLNDLTCSINNNGHSVDLITIDFS